MPPRAQSAHQWQPGHENILAQINGGELKAYQYVDYGSLVSLSNFSPVGSLMGNLMRGSMMIEGRIARMMYLFISYASGRTVWLCETGLIMLVGQLNRIAPTPEIALIH